MAERMASALTGSRPLKGSSRMSSFGSGITVAMNWTFCVMPLLRVSTLSEARLARPSLSSQFATSALTPCPERSSP